MAVGADPRRGLPLGAVHDATVITQSFAVFRRLGGQIHLGRGPLRGGVVRAEFPSREQYQRGHYVQFSAYRVG